MKQPPLQTRFRVKLFILLVVVSAAIASVGTAALYYQWRQDLINHLQWRADSIAGSVAVAIDGDRHDLLRTREDEKSPAYREIQDLLRKVREANRKIHPPGVKAEEFMRYIYTMRKLEQPGMWEFVVDIEEDAELFTHIGHPYDAKDDQEDMEYIWKHGYSLDTGSVVSDPWGDWVSAGAGIRNSQGEVVGVVGVDISAKSLGELQARISKFFILLLLGCFVLSIIVSVPLSIQVSRPVSRLIKELGRVGKGDLQAAYSRRRNDDFHELGEAFNRMVEDLREGKLVKDLLHRYLDPDIAHKIMEDSKALAEQGERIRATVAFADLRGFTQLSTELEAEDLLRLLNVYFESLLEVVREYEGMVDKFIGDGILVVYGPPLHHEDDPQRAVRMALKMHASIPQSRQRIRDFLGKELDLSLGIGISTGWVIAGNVGTEHRRDYTVVGEAVNMASRLQDLAASGEILMDETTFGLLKGELGEMEGEQVHLRGFSKPIQAFRLGKQAQSQIAKNPRQPESAQA